MKFSYKRFSKNLARPVIPITLASHGTSVGYEVLVDSGADLCIFHAEIGELLDIDITKGKKHEVFGVGGKASIFYVHPIDIIVGEHTVHTEVGFMHDVAGKRMPYGILGQKGFFEHFRVKFDLQKGEIELRHNS